MDSHTVTRVPGGISVGADTWSSGCYTWMARKGPAHGLPRKNDPLDQALTGRPVRAAGQSRAPAASPVRRTGKGPDVADCRELDLTDAGRHRNGEPQEGTVHARHSVQRSCTAKGLEEGGPSRAKYRRQPVIAAATEKPCGRLPRVGIADRPPRGGWGAIMVAGACSWTRHSGSLRSW